jgi:hypothetical protein
MARVLVLSQDPDIVLFHRLLIETAGHDATGLPGDPTIDELRAAVQSMDVIVLVTSWLLSAAVLRELAPSAWIVLVCSYGVNERTRAEWPGCDLYLNMPVHPDVLLAAVDV